MNAKYSIPQYFIATLIATATLALPTACNDDSGYQIIEGQGIVFKLTASDDWHKGMSVNENAPTTHCTSVRALSGGDTDLYLHTVVADNPAEEMVAVTRGTPVNNTDVFKTKYTSFSLSGICYTGKYPTDESKNTWTTEYAYDLYYNSTTGKPEKEGGRPLLWPALGNVRFFAFAPIVKDFEKFAGTDGSLALSKADHKGSPTLTYTVPTDVTKQVDLMTACTTASGATTRPTVDLNFGHALTAVRIKCGKDMLAGKITEVTIAGIHGTGTQVIGAETWTTSDAPEATYTISKEITLSPGDGATDKVHVPGDTPIAGTDDDDLTFLLLPQELPEGATMTIKFTDDATKTGRTLQGSLAGQTWEAGKIVTYSVSPSSIHISHTFKFSKKRATADNPGDTIPYSGVWYDATYSATAEVVQDDDSKKIEDIPADKVSFQYRFNDSESWTDCTKDADGLLTIAPQQAFTDINGNNKFSDEEAGSETGRFSLSGEYGETANCYLVDKAGYYSLRLVYGNCGESGEPAGNTNGLTYFPDHTDDGHIMGGTIPGVDDAVLLWQDSPDLVDPDNVKVNNTDGTLEFRIRRPTLAQGNAVLAVRNSSKEILWSWHIWVTPYKEEFYTPSSCYTSQPGNGNNETYNLAKYNLGWCDRHAHNDAREFKLQAVIDMSAYKGSNAQETEKTVTVDLGTFTQMEYRGSDAGDNTYYQWGRKDPMLGGIYNSQTPTYKFDGKGNSATSKEDELNMENKQVFNQYRNAEEGCDYSFCKNPGDMINLGDEASNGVSIGYTILHPYMFITNSRVDESQEDTKPNFNYRNHWHKPYKYYPVPYLSEGTHIMFNAWDADATVTDAGYIKTEVFNGSTVTDADKLRRNAKHVVKSVYDPCPPKFKVPPIEAFRSLKKIYDSGHSTLSFDSVNNSWTITGSDGKSITFQATGVRDYALRQSEWKTVRPVGQPSGSDFDYETFYKTSMPAFKELTFVSSATLVEKKPATGSTENKNAYQLLLFSIDNRADANKRVRDYVESSNSYGLPVRPERYD